MTSVKANKKIPLLLLVGPTAVGKSAVAMMVARSLSTDIISADSAQVYRYLDIGTAKPTTIEKQDINHHLIDIIYPNQLYNAAAYQKDAVNIINEVWERGKIPFMVGGTGLYIKAVTDRYAFGNEGADLGLRAIYEELACSEGLESLYERLKTVDPDAAVRIHPNDKRRIIRALEVYTLEGKQISDQVRKTGKDESPYDLYAFGLNMERELLYASIENRVDKMIESGLLDEVYSLTKRGYSSESPGLQVLGYKQLLMYLNEQLKWEDAVAEIKKQTRNLAKRQLTWFRREPAITWLTVTDQKSLMTIAEIICSKVKDIASSRANITINATNEKGAR